MGAWGPKLYQNDVSEDIRSDYKDLLRNGLDNIEATQLIINCNQDYIDDVDDAPNFWFALADTQWSLGRLLPEVKEMALKYLEDDGDIKIWEEENPKQAVIRRKVLTELKQKLLSPMPPERKVQKYSTYKCEWNIGDVFAYEFESQLAKEHGYDGKYIILIKVGETKGYPQQVIPIVRIKITNDNVIPKTKEEIDELDYVVLGRSDDAKILNQVSPLFAVELDITSKRSIPKKLQYIGNFTDLNPPSVETIYENIHKTGSADFKFLEIYVLKRKFSLLNE